MSKVLDGDKWYIKIDTAVDKTALYTFELVAKDAEGRKCSIMHYTVEVPPHPKR